MKSDFKNSLEKALTKSYLWERQNPDRHLKEYHIVNVTHHGDHVIQILTLSDNYNYGFEIYSFIDRDNSFWLSPIGMMFGQGNLYEENSEQKLICPPDIEYVSDLIEKIIIAVFGSVDGFTTSWE
jgi:hypothetical protein